jgi:hypothetical protein
VARLEQLYGSDFSLTRAPLESGGSEALLILPV